MRASRAPGADPGAAVRLAASCTRALSRAPAMLSSSSSHPLPCNNAAHVRVPLLVLPLPVVRPTRSPVPPLVIFPSLPYSCYASFRSITLCLVLFTSAHVRFSLSPLPPPSFPYCFMSRTSLLLST